MGDLGLSYHGCNLIASQDVVVYATNGSYQFIADIVDSPDPGTYPGSAFDFYSTNQPLVAAYLPTSYISGTSTADGLWEVDYQLQPETNSYYYATDCMDGCNNEVWGWDSGYYWVHVHLNQGVTLPPGALPPLPQYPAIAALGPKIPAVWAPYVSIFTPRNLTVYPSAPVTVPIAINAADVNAGGSITGLAVYQGSTKIGMATLTVNPYSFNGYLYTFFWTNVPAGTYTLTAVATNNAGVTTTSGPVTIQVSTASSTQVAANYYHSLAIKPDGTVKGWGDNTYGEVGDGTLVSRTNPVSVSGLTGIKMVAAGSAHSLALTTNGNVYAWGQNNFGQLAGPYPTYGAAYLATPNEVIMNGGPLSNVVYIAGGGANSYAVKSDGTVWAWGYDQYGQLGSGYSGGYRPVPMAASGLSNVTMVAAGTYHVLALTTNGNVYAWGNNSNGQLGNGTNTQANSPILVTNLSNIVAISAGNSTSYALDSSGIVWVWGVNAAGQLGLGTTNDSYIPVPNLALTGFRLLGITAGYNYCLALVENGTMEGWGVNAQGNLGDGTTTLRYLPVGANFSDGSQAFGLAAGANHTISIQGDRTLRSWGFNYYGELGRTTTNARSLTLDPITGF